MSVGKGLSSRLRETVRIMVPDQEPNGQGGRRPAAGTEGWKVLDTVAAEIIALRGSEAMRNSVERAVQMWKVTIRDRPDIRMFYRLVWTKTGTVMDITSAAPDPETPGALVMTGESGIVGRNRR
jgi:head-tail adaptor